MAIRLPIAEALISSRNILLGGRSNEHVLPCLEAVLADLDSIEVPSTKNIVGRCVTEAVNQIKSSDFISAGRILNLIHNLPLNEATRERWDIDYFLSMELLAFLEQFEEIKDSRLIALYVCNQIACQYLHSGS